MFQKNVNFLNHCRVNTSKTINQFDSPIQENIFFTSKNVFQPKGISLQMSEENICGVHRLSRYQIKGLFYENKMLQILYDRFVHPINHIGHLKLPGWALIIITSLTLER